MEQIKKNKKKTIKTSFAFCIIISLLAALLLSLLLSELCRIGQERLIDLYRKNLAEHPEKYYVNSYFYIIDFDLINYISATIIEEFMSPVDLALYHFLGFLSIAVFLFCFLASAAAASILFFRKKLRAPLSVLDYAAERIADNDLDFTISYSQNDEFGRLCASFEKMRAALQENQFEMWRQVEERRQLNAAFAHDLRTPLTVLKGQSELLRQYASQMPVEKITSTAETMKRHIVRLENYVSTMNDLQRLEDTPINKRPVSAKEFIPLLNSTGKAVAAAVQFEFSETILGASFFSDPAIVLQVYENLLSNAARFAKSKVCVSVFSSNGRLAISVADDGEGFQKEDLLNATKPFYQHKKEGAAHFGMGLTICKILCEKHGGSLTLSNQDGALATAKF